MKLTILSENSALEGFHAEHGLSFLIEHNQLKLLFDTGASDVFLRNALKLNIDMDSVGKVILSHGHFDHGDGLEHLQARTLICHPGCFIKRYHKRDKLYIGLVMTGCSHSGVCNIIEYAKKVTSIDVVYAVMGGFHLKTLDRQSLQTIEYFKKEKIQKVFPSHCTDEPVLSAIIREFDSYNIKAGMIIN